MESTEYYPNLEVGHIFSRSWEVFKANMGLVFGVLAVQILVTMISAIIPIIGPRSGPGKLDRVLSGILRVDYAASFSCSC